ncbi:hypothetical protein GF406_07395 [candidate division KSB1 bacterium]|nr:hypothetical protein [candidate division KSB1 bacterium]
MVANFCSEPDRLPVLRIAYEKDCFAGHFHNNDQLWRWWTLLEPGGWVEYDFHLDSHAGRDWRTGLKMMFHDRRLYDMDRFDRNATVGFRCVKDVEEGE